jgi:hypothetical protein
MASRTRSIILVDTSLPGLEPCRKQHKSGKTARSRREVAVAAMSVSFLPTPYLLLRGWPASTSSHPPQGLVQPRVMCR